MITLMKVGRKGRKRLRKRGKGLQTRSVEVNTCTCREKKMVLVSIFLAHQHLSRWLFLCYAWCITCFSSQIHTRMCVSMYHVCMFVVTKSLEVCCYVSGLDYSFLC